MKKKRKSKRKIRFSVIIPLFILVLILGGIVYTCTGSNTYTLYDNGEMIGSYKRFPIALFKMNTLDSDMAYITNQDGKALALKEGIVNFKTKDVSENTLYETKNGDGYLNGNYGVDGYYIKTNLQGTKVQFMMSGVTGWVNIEDIQLYLLDDSLSTSYYVNYDSTLYHMITSDISGGSYSGWPIGVAPDFMEEDTPYYSYDGLYFYESLNAIKEGHAINKKAFYNFYQYLPHETKTSITVDTLNNFLYDIKGITEQASGYPCLDNQSSLYGIADDFYNAQQKYGTNAAMMMSVAINESGYGQSQYSILNNNLFGHAVYDASPDDANRYTSIQDCINAHAKYFLKEGYCNKKDDRYNGSWFGNKESGINVNYASDPYWGEKAASFYFQLDQMNDFVDYNSIEFKH